MGLFSMFWLSVADLGGSLGATPVGVIGNCGADTHLCSGGFTPGIPATLNR
jgi:hypothetical protein